MKNDDFLGVLMGNPVRARIIRLCLFNQSESFTVPQIAKRVAGSPASVMKELAVLEQIGILWEDRKSLSKKISLTKKGGKKKVSPRPSRSEQVWRLNQDFKHLRALSMFVHEVSPVRYGNIVEALRGVGRLTAVVVSGCFMGDITRPADLIVVADNLDEALLERSIKSLEPLFGREIRYAVFPTEEFRYRMTIQDRLIRDTLDYPHMVLLDRARMFLAKNPYLSRAIA